MFNPLIPLYMLGSSLLYLPTSQSSAIHPPLIYLIIKPKWYISNLLPVDITYRNFTQVPRASMLIKPIYKSFKESGGGGGRNAKQDRRPIF
ncbi:hypothetical protein BJY04DRAFT_58424 [Aspergillus karnatakaensis]|uniref:uncharacterized protein n=1 Tax=Aspergillus karnatakaensis TaxID=1810916 RepID=UPI003CCD130A